MRSLRLPICLLAIYLCTFSQSALAAEPPDSNYQIQGGSGGDVASFSSWYREFKIAVQKNDKSSIAKMINYPLSVYWGGEFDNYTGKATKAVEKNYSQKTFLANYDRIFSRSLKNRLLNAWKSEFWDRDQGVCLGSGVVWFEVDSEKKPTEYRIKTINYSLVPPDTEAIFQQIKTAERNTAPASQIANLYGKLADAYERAWTPDKDRAAKLAFQKKGEEAYRKAISLRSGALATGADQAKDYRLLADNLAEQNRRNEAFDMYMKALAMQVKVLPASSDAISKTMDELQSIVADIPGRNKEFHQMRVLHELAGIKERERQLQAKSNKNKIKELSSKYKLLGDSYKTLGQQADAINAYNKSMSYLNKVKPSDDFLTSDLLEAYVAAGQLDLGKKLYKQIRDPDTRTSAGRALALAYGKKGMASESDKYMDPRINEIKEGGYSLYFELAKYIDIYAESKRYDKGIALADWCITKGKDDTGYDKCLVAKARIETILEHYSTAEDCYQKALKYLSDRYPTDPPRLDYKYELSRTLLLEKKYSEGLKVIDEVISYLKKNGRTEGNEYADRLVIKAQLLAGLKDPQTEKMFQEAIALKTRTCGSNDKSVKELQGALEQFQKQK